MLLLERVPQLPEFESNFRQIVVHSKVLQDLSWKFLFSLR